MYALPLEDYEKCLRIIRSKKDIQFDLDEIKIIINERLTDPTSNKELLLGMLGRRIKDIEDVMKKWEVIKQPQKVAF